MEKLNKTGHSNSISEYSITSAYCISKCNIMSVFELIQW